MPPGSPDLPYESVLAVFGLANPTELGGGQQSRVLAVDSDAGRLVVKLSQADQVNRDLLERRLHMVEDLARLSPLILPPTRVGGRLINEASGWLLTAFPYVVGRRPDPGNVADSVVMGATLAELHACLKELSRFDLPRVAALETADTAEIAPDQLLHGDFNNSNIVLTDDGPRIFDFDDSGYGPVEFDVANTLYMVLFDSRTGDGAGPSYGEFRTAFLQGYSDQSGYRPPDSTLDSLIDIRVHALESWIADPAEGPIGIRTSDAAWLEVLRRFVDDWKSDSDNRS
jgi:Ser/Thr protein kinase RdoA (MazF antagonist)